MIAGFKIKELPIPTFYGDEVCHVNGWKYGLNVLAAALKAREHTGIGQVVDVSLLYRAVCFLMTAIPEFLLLGRESKRNGTRDPYVAPANNFQSGDSEWVHISAGTDALFPRLARRQVRQACWTTRASQMRPSGLRTCRSSRQEVSRFAALRTAHEIVLLIEQAGVPCAKVACISDVVTNPQLRHRNQIVELDVPAMGKEESTHDTAL